MTYIPIPRPTRFATSSTLSLFVASINGTEYMNCHIAPWNSPNMSVSIHFEFTFHNKMMDMYFDRPRQQMCLMSFIYCSRKIQNIWFCVKHTILIEFSCNWAENKSNKLYLLQIYTISAYFDWIWIVHTAVWHIFAGWWTKTTLFSKCNHFIVLIFLENQLYTFAGQYCRSVCYQRVLMRSKSYKTVSNIIISISK